MSSGPSNKVIIAVDDDPDILDFMESYLSDFEFDLHTASNSEDAWMLIDAFGIDLLLVDLRLENESGLDFARAVAERHGVPIIMVSAITDDIEKVVGLETVLSDYVEKPVEPRLLLARIRAQLRNHELRTTGFSASPAPTRTSGSALSFGDFVLDSERRMLSHTTEGPIDLTSTEFRLLELLVTNADTVFSRQEIVDRLGLESSNHMMRSIDVLVLRLRRKVEQRPSSPRYLQTRRNKGYVFCLAS